MKQITTSLLNLPFLVGALSATLFLTPRVHGQEDALAVTHFDNLEVAGDTANGAFKPIPAPTPGYPMAMAQSFIATGENVAEVTFGFGRFGTPGGTMIVSIREMDAATEEPGNEVVGVLGELKVNDVAQNENDICAQPNKNPNVSVTGFVGGLVPGERYVVHIIESLDDKPAMSPFGTGSCGVIAEGYAIDLVPNGGEEQIGEGGTHLLDWPYPPDGILKGVWQPFESKRAHLSIRIRIEGTSSDPFITHFDNLEVAGDTPDGAFKPIPAPTPGYPMAMAQSFVATGENVTEVTFGFGRFGTPGGTMIVSIREMDAATEEPGNEVVGVLGELKVNDVAQNENDICTQPNKNPNVSVTGFVDGLVPGERYFVHIIESLEDKPAMSPFGTGPCGVIKEGYAIDLVPNGREEQTGEGGTHLLDWPYPPDGILEGVWQPFESKRAHLSIRIRIEGMLEPPSDPFITTTEDGSISKVPDLEAYPIGSEVTVTAAPAEGFEFVKWTYGDEEFTTNPVVIAVKEGATLAAIFGKIEEPEPLQLDIAHAVAISWDSQSGKTYQIHASRDMENWEVTVDAIEGTGERLTHCFIREETEVFYRVEERR